MYSRWQRLNTRLAFYDATLTIGTFLVDVMRLLRDGTVLAGEDVRSGLEDLAAGRTIPLRDDLVGEVTAIQKAREASIQVEPISIADRQIRNLRGRRRVQHFELLVSYRTVDVQLAVTGYSGSVFEQLCCRHLYAEDRMIVAWTAPDHAVVIAIGPHDRSANDVQRMLLDGPDRDVPVGERYKPPCCDEMGFPPGNPKSVTEIVGALKQVGRVRRRAL